MRSQSESARSTKRSITTSCWSRCDFSFAIDRRSFVQMLGAGVLVTALGTPAFAQRRGGRGRGGGFRGGPPPVLSARIHFGDDGTITVLSGKVDGGQGARGQLAQAAAEELRVPLEQDSRGAGRHEHCAERRQHGRQRHDAANRAGRAAGGGGDATIARGSGGETVGRRAERGRSSRRQNRARRVESIADVMPRSPRTKRWRRSLRQQTPSRHRADAGRRVESAGHRAAGAGGRDKVLGRHQYPSDIKRPGMLYGRVLRSPKYRGEVGVGRSCAGEGDGRTSSRCRTASLSAWRRRRRSPPSRRSKRSRKRRSGKRSRCRRATSCTTILRENADGGVPKNPFADEVAKAPKSLKATYTIAYVQHAPLEPRTAVAEWADGKLTVWTATQNPFGVRGELAEAFRLPEEDVRVIVPDFGSGYGGKHTGECAVEAARIAKAAGKPVMLRWTREEEFTWAYFRPAAVIDVEASLDADGPARDVASREHQRGRQLDRFAVRCAAEAVSSRSARSRRCGTARIGRWRRRATRLPASRSWTRWRRLAGVDPLEFRLAHLDDPRLRPVLEEAAKRFKWTERVKNKQPNRGVGWRAASTRARSWPAVRKWKSTRRRKRFTCGTCARRSIAGR